MQTRQLAGTDVITTVLGFGCGGIFRMPSARQRLALLETAYEVGIRHFDVAPMYGLGSAEAELAPILTGDRASLTVATKFGIEPTFVGRAIGRLQAPTRAVLARRPAWQGKAESSGRSPASGIVGRSLYAAAADPVTAQRGLLRSLSKLRTTHVDVFAVHEPAQSLRGNPDALADCLDRMQADGAIRCWAVAGEPPDAASPATRLTARAPVVQRSDDILSELPAAGGGLITYRAISRAVPAVTAYLHREPNALGVWNERLRADLSDPEVLPALLLRQAVRRNACGPVLFSTTRPERIRAAAAAVAGATEGAAAEADAMAALAEAVGAHRAARSAS